jgi:hypothetical protein
MALMDTLITKTTPTAPKLIVYGVPGVGKTSLAAEAGALLIDMENGAGAVPNLQRTPYIEKYETVMGWLREIAQMHQPPSVLAIDTLDWLVRRVVEVVTQDLDPKSKGVVNTLGGSHGGYFKGREVVENVVHGELLPALNYINSRGVAILMLAHAENVKMRTPEGIDLSVAAPDIPGFIRNVFIEWADAVLYAKFGTERKRVLVTVESGTVTAKNRYGLDPEIPLSWKVITEGVAAWHAKIVNFDNTKK